MKFINDRALKDMNIYTWQSFGRNGLAEKIKELEARLEKLETKPKRGRPPLAKNDEE